jgi:hypothetical protein
VVKRLKASIVKDTKTTRTKVKKKCLNPIFKQGMKQDYVIQKTKTQDLRTRTQDVHDKCGDRFFIMLPYANIEHGKNLTRLWCKIVPKIGVEQTEGNERSYFYLYPFGDLV